MNTTLTLNKIGKTILKNVIGILVAGIICGILGGLYAHHKKTTTYRSVRPMLIQHSYSGNDANEKAMADISMTKTYAKIIESNNVAKETHKLLPKKMAKKYSTDKLSSMINAMPVEQSTVINVSVVTSNPHDSAMLVNTATKAAAKEIKIISPSAGQVKLFAKTNAADAESRTNPSVKKYVLLGTAVGILIGMIAAFSVTTWKHLI